MVQKEAKGIHLFFGKIMETFLSNLFIKKNIIQIDECDVN